MGSGGCGQLSWVVSLSGTLTHANSHFSFYALVWRVTSVLTLTHTYIHTHSLSLSLTLIVDLELADLSIFRNWNDLEREREVRRVVLTKFKERKSLFQMYSSSIQQFLFLSSTSILTYIHTHMHTYIYTHFYTYIHTYLHAYMHTYKHTHRGYKAVQQLSSGDIYDWNQ